MKAMVAGFLFDNTLRYVALILKEKPPWQAGRMNGIGGKVEPGETPSAAMSREFLEETRMIIRDWTLFAKLSREFDWSVDFFYARATYQDMKAQISKVEIEAPVIVEVAYIQHYHEAIMIPNLKWLIPMAINHMQGKEVHHLQEYPRE